MTDDMPPLPQPARPSASKALMMALKICLFALVLFFVGRSFARELIDVRKHEIHVQWRFLALAACSLSSSLLINVSVRRRLLMGFCTPPRWRAMASISWVPLMGKYLPGKVFSLAGTVWMFRRYNIREPVAASMLIMANGLSMALGLALGIPLTMAPQIAGKNHFVWAWALLMLIAFVVALRPRNFLAICNFGLRRIGRRPMEEVPTIRHYAAPLSLMLCNWVLTGVGLWCIARALTPVAPKLIPLFVSTAALAATIGLLAFFTPAGLGVREGIQLYVLSAVVATSAVALVPLVMRLMQTCVELVFVAIGLAIRERQATPVVHRNGPAPATP